MNSVVLLLGCGAWDQIQGLAHAKLVLCQEVIGQGPEECVLMCYCICFKPNMKVIPSITLLDTYIILRCRLCDTPQKREAQLSVCLH